MSALERGRKFHRAAGPWSWHPGFLLSMWGKRRKAMSWKEPCGLGRSPALQKGPKGSEPFRGGGGPPRL